MADARCSCGALTLALAGAPKLVVACHCVECQRRTGAPFGAGAFYPAEAVAVSGARKEFIREAESGGRVHNSFCPTCGSTVYWKADNLPSMVGVAIGAHADPSRLAPALSIFERSKHDWVQIVAAAQRFQQGSGTKSSGAAR